MKTVQDMIYEVRLSTKMNLNAMRNSSTSVRIFAWKPYLNRFKLLFRSIANCKSFSTWSKALRFLTTIRTKMIKHWWRKKMLRFTSAHDAKQMRGNCQEHETKTKLSRFYFSLSWAWSTNFRSFNHESYENDYVYVKISSIYLICCFWFHQAVVFLFVWAKKISILFRSFLDRS